MGRIRRSSFPRTSGAVRRRSSWSGGPEGLLGAISTSSVTLFPTGAQALLNGLTHVRFRGELLLYITVAGGAATEGFRWAFGVGIVSENAFGVGVTAVPDPIADIGWDGWLLYETGQLATSGSVLDQAAGNTVVRVPLDSKAMRKIKASDVMIGVLSTTEIGDGSVMNGHLSSRILAKLA